MMNAHLEERDGFTVVEKNKTPPENAETLVIPDAKPQAGGEATQLDLAAVPSGPASRGNTQEPKESKKAPVLP